MRGRSDSELQSLNFRGLCGFHQTPLLESTACTTNRASDWASFVVDVDKMTSNVQRYGDLVYCSLEGRMLD